MSRRYPALPDLKAGIYQHWKGPLYQVLGYGHDANHPTRLVVVYIGLSLDGASEGPRLSVRTVEDFFAAVCVVTGLDPVQCDRHLFDGSVEQHEPQVRQRFTYVGPDYRGRPSQSQAE